MKNLDTVSKGSPCFFSLYQHFGTEMLIRENVNKIWAKLYCLPNFFGWYGCEGDRYTFVKIR